MFCPYVYYILSIWVTCLVLFGIRVHVDLVSSWILLIKKERKKKCEVSKGDKEMCLDRVQIIEALNTIKTEQPNVLLATESEKIHILEWDTVKTKHHTNHNEKLKIHNNWSKTLSKQLKEKNTCEQKELKKISGIIMYIYVDDQMDSNAFFLFLNDDVQVAIKRIYSNKSTNSISDTKRARPILCFCHFHFYFHSITFTFVSSVCWIAAST